MSRIPNVTAMGGIAAALPPAEPMLCTTIESAPNTTTRVSEFRSSSTDTRAHLESGGSLNATCP